MNASEPEEAERRRNLFLRGLVDEMLQQIRQMQAQVEEWEPEERERAEEVLARIMSQVRSSAARPPSP